MSRAARRAGVVLLMVLGAGCGGAPGQHTGAVAAGPPPPPLLDAGTQRVGDVCQGLRPHPPGAPVSVKRYPNYFGELEPLLDGEGNVLGGSGSHFDFFNTIYAPDGGVLALFDFAAQSRFDLTVALASGFAGIRDVSYPPSGPPVLVRMNPDGGLESTPTDLVEYTVPNGGFHEDPPGGLVLIAGEVLTSYDDELAPRWSVKLPLDAGQSVVGRTPVDTGVGVDVAGNTLVLFGVLAEEFDVSGLWVDATGHPGPTFSIGHHQIYDSFKFIPDVRGGVLLGFNRCSQQPCVPMWKARYAALSTVAEPVPDWLSARPAAALHLHLIKDRTAYAVGGAPLPACALEVLAADGTSCGFADFSAALAGSAQGAALVTANAGSGSGPPCERVLDIGRDGTVISVGQATGNGCSPPSCAVLWDWFPAYFR